MVSLHHSNLDGPLTDVVQGLHRVFLDFLLLLPLAKEDFLSAFVIPISIMLPVSEDVWAKDPVSVSLVSFTFRFHVQLRPFVWL